jgi:acetyl esterase/lipase
MSTDYEAQKEDTFIYPAKMSETVLAQLPKTVVFTAEFDAFRRDATNFAKRLSQVDKLADFCVHPGINHAFPVSGSDSPACQMFWKDIARAINAYA